MKNIDNFCIYNYIYGPHLFQLCSKEDSSYDVLKSKYCSQKFAHPFRH